MSAPFGPSPSLREYLEWVRTDGKCIVRDGIRAKKSCIQIESPDGRKAHLVGLSKDESVSHSLVAALDRRLGVDAPFPKTPQPYR